jgi:hypothetical protein
MVAMRYYLSGKFVPKKFENDLVILLVAVHCQRTSSVRVGCIGEYPLLYTT